MEKSLNHTPSDAAVKHLDEEPASLRAQERDVAVAIQADPHDKMDQGRVTASGYGKVAHEILDIAFAHDIKVRQDGPLAHILATLDLDTPIPSEAIVAVAEILAKVYEANAALMHDSRNSSLSSA